LQRPVSITLSSIILGSITQPGKDEAYVTYWGDFMLHVDGFGGGALFEHVGGTWRLVQWYPAQQRDQCLALPGAGRLEALCQSRNGWAGVGFDWINVAYIVPPPGEGSPVFTLSRQVSAVHGDCDGERGRPYGLPQSMPVYCTMPDKSQGMLVAIGDLTRSAKPGLFAVASGSFARPEDLDEACAKTCLFDAIATAGVIGFKLDGNRITAVMPAHFSRAASTK
jgi:hypothetical protein